MKANKGKTIMEFINSLRLSIGQYDFENDVLIGKGRYGNVYEVISFDDNKLYASKVLKFENTK
jgi:serine/threonine protein kinase